MAQRAQPHSFSSQGTIPHMVSDPEQTFIQVADFLKGKNHLSNQEWNVAYAGGFHRDLKLRIKTRLQYRKPNHFLESSGKCMEK